MKKSFTLIELLIVVVIIGILAAVALPQYNMMVTRSKLGGMLNATGALRQAVQAYRTECGHAPPTDPNNSWVWERLTSEKILPLGIDLPFNKYQVWWTTASDDPYGRLAGMNISADNMAFLIGDASYGTEPPGIPPAVIMSEAGKKRIWLSGNVNLENDWGPVE